MTPEVYKATLAARNRLNEALEAIKEHDDDKLKRSLELAAGGVEIARGWIRVVEAAQPRAVGWEDQRVCNLCKGEKWVVAYPDTDVLRCIGCGVPVEHSHWERRQK